MGAEVNLLAIEWLEKALNNCVVMTVSTSAHACEQVVLFPESLPLITQELAALVALNHN